MTDQLQPENAMAYSPNGQNPAEIPSQKEEIAPPKKEYVISSKTETSYAGVVAKLTENSERKRTDSRSMTEWVVVTPSDIVQDFIESDNLSRNTIITYTYALLWHLRRNNHIKEFAEAESKLLEYSANFKAKNKKPAADKVVNPWKRKSIPKADLNLLIEELTEMSSGGAQWAGRAQRWMLAGLATGIRPAEWATAVWVDDAKTLIRIENGKRKADTPGFLRGTAAEANQTGLATHRDIPVENEADRMVIDNHLNTLRAFIFNETSPMSIDDFRKRCTISIWRACKTIWGTKKRYSLYSARKQFAANQRAAVGAVRTAELMGHSRSDTPSASAYGSANQAYSRTGKDREKGSKEHLVPTPNAPTQVESEVQQTDI